MPRLKQRSDGCYYILHHYRDCNTWQIDRDGFKFLESERIGVDELFPTDLFMEMWEQELVYVGSDRKGYWRNIALRGN